MDFQQFKQQYEKKAPELLPATGADKPLVSVVVTAFNHEKFIEQTLEHILNQKTDFYFEVIIGEDDSADNTRQICKQIYQKYANRVTVVLQNRINKIEILGSPSGRFNLLYCMYLAQGSYVALCDGDDYWQDTKKLQQQIAHLEKNPACVLTYHGWENKYTNKTEKNETLVPQVFLTPQKSTMVFKNITDTLHPNVLRSPNFDTFLRFQLKAQGSFALIKNIQPTIRHIHGSNTAGHLNSIQKLPRRIETFKILGETWQGHRMEKEIREKLIQYQILEKIFGGLLPQHQPRLRQQLSALKLSVQHKKLSYFVRNNWEYYRYVWFKKTPTHFDVG